MGTVAEKTQVRIAIGADGMNKDAGYWLCVDFNTRLQYRGTDFKVYANTGYVENKLDSALLVSIMNQLLTPTSAVHCVQAEPFKLLVYANSTVTTEEIMSSVIFAAQHVGLNVEYKNLT